MSHSEDNTVTFDIPPIFCISLFLAMPKIILSANGTRGAPMPPAAISFVLKSPTVNIPVLCDMTEISPICNVLFVVISDIVLF